MYQKLDLVSNFFWNFFGPLGVSCTSEFVLFQETLVVQFYCLLSMVSIFTIRVLQGVDFGFRSVQGLVLKLLTLNFKHIGVRCVKHLLLQWRYYGVPGFSRFLQVPQNALFFKSTVGLLNPGTPWRQCSLMPLTKCLTLVHNILLLVQHVRPLWGPNGPFLEFS